MERHNFAPICACEKCNKVINDYSQRIVTIHSEDDSGGMIAETTLCYACVHEFYEVIKDYFPNMI
jgi:hypothetical protein